MSKRLDYNAKLVQRTTVSDGLAIFNIQLDQPLTSSADDGQRFVPGQYLTLGLNRPADDPMDDRPLSVVRPISIASGPEHPYLQFYIRYVTRPQSTLPFTHLLFSLENGERIFVRPSPKGQFTEKHTCGDRGGQTLIMLAAGTGLAPFMSMVRSKVRQNPNISLEDHVIIHGVSNPTYLGYYNELQMLSRQNGLKYLPTISRRREAPTWKGCIGRAEHVLAPDRIEDTEKQLGIAIRPGKAVVTICGLTGTIRETIVALAARGFVPHHRKIRKELQIPDSQPSTVFYEQYDSEPVVNPKNVQLVTQLRTQIHKALGL